MRVGPDGYLYHVQEARCPECGLPFRKVICVARCGRYMQCHLWDCANCYPCQQKRDAGLFGKRKAMLAAWWRIATQNLAPLPAELV